MASKLQRRMPTAHAFLLCIVLLLLPAFCFSQSAISPSRQVRGNWTQFHNVNMQRWNPDEKVLNVHNVGRLRLKWRSRTCCYDFFSPAVANGVI